MKKILSGNRVFLVLALVCIALAVLLSLYNYRGQVKDIDKVRTITESKIQTKLTALELQNSTIQDYIFSGKKLSFYALNKLANSSPFLIFKNKKLVYWSDNRVVPGYEYFRGDYRTKVINTKPGKLLVDKYNFYYSNHLYEVVSITQLSYNYSIENKYFSSGFNKDLFDFPGYIINTYKGSNSVEVKSPEGTYLFSIESSEQYSKPVNKSYQLVILIISMLGITLLGIYFYLLAVSFHESDFSVLILITSFALIRFFMLWLEYPTNVLELDLFHSKYFASSDFNPSAGDLLLNTICILVFSWYIFRNYHRLYIVKKIIQLGSKTPSFLITGLLIISYYLYYNVYYILKVISRNSQTEIDISANIDISFLKGVFIVVFIMSCVSVFHFAHVLYRMAIGISKHHRFTMLKWYLVSVVLYILIGVLRDDIIVQVLIVTSIHTLIVIIFQLPNHLKNVEYRTYLYIINSALLCAVLGAWAVFDHIKERDNVDKQKYASQLFIENDIYGEYLLSVASLSIKEDLFIKNKLLTPFSSSDLVEQKIKKIYLSDYFDRYDLSVFVFDRDGVPLDPERLEEKSYQEYFKLYASQEYATEYSDIYFIKENKSSLLRRYVNFNIIEKGGVKIGYVILDLKHKKVSPNSLFPELLIDKKVLNSDLKKDYHYAVFVGGNLLYNYGNFDYERYFKKEWFLNEKIYEVGIDANGMNHLAIQGEGAKVIVISSERVFISRFFSNMSFLFFILILFISILLLIYAFYLKVNNTEAGFTTKIQIYLNIAFFLPLIIISITTISIIGANYRDGLHQSFKRRAESMASNIGVYMDEYRKHKYRDESVENELLEFSRYTESDLNLYNERGELIFTSQPAIFENQLFSKYINPSAFADIHEHKNNTVLITESIGNLTYNSVYVAVKSFDTGKVLGILSLPFFESAHELNKQIIEILTSILNIFFVTFFLFLSLSYFASGLLTIPLKIITQKIKKTNLSGNEPLVWSTKDEIGLLVNEYNSMLMKLEESKMILSKGEKESAWREMAQQVAHEIKNPLTPMKLKIQQLQKILKESKDTDEKNIYRSLEGLLMQVDHLSEIATSFSAFAKMPIPVNELFDLAEMLRNLIVLHNNQGGVSVVSDIDNEVVMVNGDPQLMSGIFTNLLLNAIQSVPADKTPEVIIKLKILKHVKKVIVSVKDNGSGIPDEIQHKVFMPNFSTKFSGSGIGLAVAKRGVDNAGGKIWFETSNTSGTTFYIELPLVT